MDVKLAIAERRAYRSLVQTVIDRKLVEDLAKNAQLAPSCFNNQPWRFVFVYSQDVLEQLHSALSRGNKWAEAASLIVVVYTKKDLDCVLPGREYSLFDTGMATAFLILRATELGLVAHPIAGFDEMKVKELLNIPRDMTVITLIMIGKHSDFISNILSEGQVKSESTRPPRHPLDEFIRER